MRHVISADGSRLAVETSGAGPDLVLVNGALTDRSVVATLRPHLTGFTLHAYDRRGRGDSTDTPPYAPEREIEDLDAVVRQTGTPPFVYGHSSGAILALRAAASGLPIRRLAIYEAPIRLAGPRGALPRLEAAVSRDDREAALWLFLGDEVGLPRAVVEQVASSPAWRQMLALAHTTPYDTAISGTATSLVPTFAAISVPSLVLHGTAGLGWLAETAQAIAAAIPGALARRLDGQPHSPAPDVLGAALAEFFSARV